MNKLHSNSLGIQDDEIKTTYRVLQKYKEAADKELQRLKKKIIELEKQCE